MTTFNNSPATPSAPQETPAATPETAPTVTVEVSAPAEVPQENAATPDVPVSDPAIVDQIHSEVVDTVSEVVVPIVAEIDQKTEENSDDILRVMEWQTQMQQTSEAQTEAIQSILAAMQTMGATLEQLVEMANQEVQQTPSASQNGGVVDPEKTPAEAPEQQEAPDNKPEKAAAQKRRSWI